MDIDSICLNLGITNKKAINKAKEYSRLSKVKMPLGLGPSEVCKPTACVALACRLYSIQYDKEKAIKNSGGSEKIFHSALSSLQKILKIKNTVSIAEIATEFGHLGIIKQCENLLEIYKQKFLGGCKSLQSQYIDFSNVEFSAAVFYVMAVQNTIKIDKAKIIKFANCNDREFQNVVNSIVEYCYQDSNAPTTPPKNRSKKETIRIVSGGDEVDEANASANDKDDEDYDPNKKKKPAPKKKTTTTTTTSSNSTKSDPSLQVKRKRDFEDAEETVLNDGTLTIQEERELIQRNAKAKYVKWTSTVLQNNELNSNKIKSIQQTHTKQTHIDSFFNVKKEESEDQ